MPFPIQHEIVIYYHQISGPIRFHHFIFSISNITPSFHLSISITLHNSLHFHHFLIHLLKSLPVHIPPPLPHPSSQVLFTASPSTTFYLHHFLIHLLKCLPVHILPPLLHPSSSDFPSISSHRFLSPSLPHPFSQVPSPPCTSHHFLSRSLPHALTKLSTFVLGILFPGLLRDVLNKWFCCLCVFVNNKCVLYFLSFFLISFLYIVSNLIPPLSLLPYFPLMFLFLFLLNLQVQRTSIACSWDFSC